MAQRAKFSYHENSRWAAAMTIEFQKCQYFQGRLSGMTAIYRKKSPDACNEISY